MTPTIQDHRQRTADVPAVECLERIIPLIPPDHLRGIRNIVLLDRDYRGRKALARYVVVKGTRAADIELFLDSCASWPEGLRTDRIVVTFRLGWRLMHEIYHHRIRRPRGFRRPSNRLEDERAERWAHEQAHRILETLFPKAQHQEAYERVWSALEETRRATEAER